MREGSLLLSLPTRRFEEMTEQAFVQGVYGRYAFDCHDSRVAERIVRESECPRLRHPRMQPPQRAFVGREREMAELCAGLEVPASDRRRVLLISGEAGIGKTRLAEEFASYAASRGTRVVWGRCWEGGGVPAYWPWIQALRTLLADSALELPKISASAELAQLMPELRVSSESPNAAAATSARSDPEQARFRLFDSVTSLLKDAARLQPLMLVLDDLHDADQPSLLMLQFVARELGGSRIMLVGAYREIELRRSPALSKLIGEILRDGHQLPLAGLSREEVARMIECYSGEAPAIRARLGVASGHSGQSAVRRRRSARAERRRPAARGPGPGAFETSGWRA